MREYMREYLVTVNGETRVVCADNSSTALRHGVESFGPDGLVYGVVRTRGNAVEAPTMLHGGWFQKGRKTRPVRNP